MFDYNDSTFLGYYNYVKVAGELGKLEGTYNAFFHYHQKRIDQAAYNQYVIEWEYVIERVDGGFNVTRATYDKDRVRTARIHFS